jgi:nucleotide-binding universal stress UspA family protein
MKTLLVLINDPINSEGFIRYSVEMAADMKMNLHLLYIQNPALYTLSSGTAAATSHPVGSDIDVVRLEEERKNAINAIEKNLENFRNNISSDISINVSSEAGAMDLVVNRIVADNKADMLVVEGQNEKDLWILDSTDTELILRANCPGWLIPAGAKYQSFRKIIYTTDYHEKDIQTLRDLINITGKLSPEITALHVTDSDEARDRTEKPEFRENIVRQTGYTNISVQSIEDEKGKDLGENIHDHAKGVNADLIVLLKENKKFFERIFKSSVTKKVMKKTTLPVLVYHEKLLEEISD